MKTSKLHLTGRNGAYIPPVCEAISIAVEENFMSGETTQTYTENEYTGRGGWVIDDGE